MNYHMVPVSYRPHMYGQIQVYSLAYYLDSFSCCSIGTDPEGHTEFISILF